MMKYFRGVGIISASIIMLSAFPAAAQVVGSTPTVSSSTTATTTAATSTGIVSTVQDQIQALLDQINTLKAQLVALISKNGVTQSIAQGVQQTFQLTTPLQIGANGEEVRKLQQVLATDPTLFSKDNVTGYFGPITQDAVEKFQKHFGIDALGIVGPHTMEKINELLKSAGIEKEQDLNEHDLGNLDDNESEQGDNNASSTSQHEGEHGGSSSNHGDNGGDN